MEAAGIEPETFADGRENGASTRDFGPTCGAASALHKNDFECRCLTLDSRLLPIIDAWGQLPEALRQALEAICLQRAPRNANQVST
jgi:hypothetical protein